MSRRQRVHEQPGWVLHTRAWRETSLIVEVLSRDHGRMGLVAKGARRPGSALRGALMAFQPLLLSWSGAGELKTMTRADWQGGLPRLGGLALMCGYYLNELVVRLSAREDAHPPLFAAYVQALSALAHDLPPAPTLRAFELALLRALGYAPELEREGGQGAAIKAEEQYVYCPENGLSLAPATSAVGAGLRVRGQTLLDLAAEDFTCRQSVREAKPFLRALIEQQLQGARLESRRILQQLSDL